MDPKFFKNLFTPGILNSLVDIRNGDLSNAKQKARQLYRKFQNQFPMKSCEPEV